MTDTAIPTKRREQVTAREQGRCARCPGPGGETHHRRSRSVRGEHRHCSCNMVRLCNTCHRWVHANPRAAQDLGLIVSRTIEVPGDVPALLFRGVSTLTCDGTYAALTTGDTDGTSGNES